MKILKITILFCISLLITQGCSTSQKRISNIKDKEAGVETIYNSFKIKSSGSHEECVELKPGQIFDYEYDASNFVNFNIHYHAEDKVHYPASRNGAMMGKGMIDPATHEFFTEEQEFYCLMWDNLNDETITVSFSSTLRNK